MMVNFRSIHLVHACALLFEDPHCEGTKSKYKMFLKPTPNLGDLEGRVAALGGCERDPKKKHFKDGEKHYVFDNT